MKVIKDSKYSLFLFMLILLSNFNLKSFEYNKNNMFSSINSRLGIKSYVTLFSLMAASVYLMYKKNYNANQLKQEIKQENEFIQKNLKITPKTIFVFDINDVIIKPDFNKIFSIIQTKILSNHKSLLASALVRPYLYYIVFKEVSKGGVPEQILTKIQEAYPQFSDLTYLGLELANAQKEVPGMFSLLQNLKNDGNDLLLLSNVANEKIDKENIKDSSLDMLKKQFPIFNLFNLNASLLTSKEDGYLKKPNDKFFKKFLTKFEQVYSKDRIKDIVFVDDRLKNVIAARKEGIASIWFTSSIDLLKKITAAKPQPLYQAAF